MKRNRRRNKRNNYAVLEPRQLLVTTGLAQFDGDTSIETGLIVNGGFDQNDIADRTSQRVAITDIEGWNQTSGASDTASLVGFDDSPRGTGFHLDDQADVLESIFQDVDTESGQLYTLAFDLRGRTAGDTASADTNDIEILWDGESVGNFRGITDFWQTFTVDVTGGSSDLTRLVIQEVNGSGNDGVGALLDNLRLVPVESQTVENGSFEDNESGTLAQDAVPGWNVTAEEAQRLVDVQSGTGSNGTRFLNVDRQATDSDIVFRNIATETGGVYFVSFDLRSESGVVGEDEEVRVRWNDQWVGTYRGTEDWQGYGFTVRADSDSTRLVFREPGNTFTGDGNGPLLDNLRITKVLPALSISLNDTSTIEFTENGDAVDLGSRIDTINSTVTGAVTGFSVSMPGNADSATESVSITTSSGVQQSQDGLLTFSGDLTSAELLAVLQTLEYENTSENPTAGTRAITVQLNAADISSPAVTLNVNVTAANDAPVVDSIADTNAVANTEFTAQATATDPENDTVTWTVSATGTAIEAGDAQPTVDAQGNISWTPARAGSAVFTVRATDPGSLFSEQNFTVTVALEALDRGPVLVNSGTDLPDFDATAAVDPAVGETIADFNASTITGGDFNSLAGVPRIYSTLAHWCPACNRELPEIVEWMADTDLGDVEFVAAAVSVRETSSNYPPFDWLNDAGFEGTVIVDNEAAKLMDLLGTGSVPFLVAVDENGRVVERISGESTRAQLDAVLALLQN